MDEEEEEEEEMEPRILWNRLTLLGQEINGFGVFFSPNTPLDVTAWRSSTGGSQIISADDPKRTSRYSLNRRHNCRILGGIGYFFVGPRFDYNYNLSRIWFSFSSGCCFPSSVLGSPAAVVVVVVDDDEFEWCSEWTSEQLSVLLWNSEPQDRRIAGSQDRFFFQCASYGYKRFLRFWKSDFGFRFFPGFWTFIYPFLLLLLFDLCF